MSLHVFSKLTVRLRSLVPPRRFRLAALVTLLVACAIGRYPQEESTASSDGAWTIFFPLMDAAFDGVRGSSRFRELRRKAKMDEKSLVSPNGVRGI